MFMGGASGKNVAASGRDMSHLIPCNRVLLEKTIVKKLPAFYGNQTFTILTTARHQAPILSQINKKKKENLLRVSLKSILKLSSPLRLGLPSGLFLSGVSIKKLYAFLSRACCLIVIFRKS
jgi:hypothetical protein